MWENKIHGLAFCGYTKGKWLFYWHMWEMKRESKRCQGEEIERIWHNEDFHWHLKFINVKEKSFFLVSQK